MLIEQFGEYNFHVHIETIISVSCRCALEKSLLLIKIFNDSLSPCGEKHI